MPTTIEAGYRQLRLHVLERHVCAGEHPARHRHTLHQETDKALQSPEFQAKLANFGADPMLMRPGEFDAYVRSEIAANKPLVKAAGLAAK